jgi:hypothetical protein
MDRLRILVHYMNVMQSFEDSIKNEQIRLIWEQLSEGSVDTYTYVIG